jgi:PAS domain S-box-containing protein
MPVNLTQAGPAVKPIAAGPARALAENNRLLENCRLISRLYGLVGVGVGVVVLVGGWICNIPWLRMLTPGYSAMVPNTALGIMLCGAALWFDHGGRAKGAKRIEVQVCAGIAGLLGLVTLSQYVLGKDLGVDRLIIPFSTVPGAPGRMSLISSGILALLGGALFLFHGRRGFAAAQYLVLIAAALSLFKVVGAVYGLRAFYGLGLGAIAVHASLTFAALSAAVLLSRPDWGLMSTITSRAPGGVMARRLLPAAVLIPIATGWLRWHGQLLGYYDTAFGLALHTSVDIVIFAFLIWRSGQILNGLDIERNRAERNVLQLADSMPQIVWTATPAGELDYFNQRCYDYNGMTFEQTRDGGWVSMIHPDEARDVMDRQAHAFAIREPYTMEYRFRRASDGMYRWHLARAIPVFTPEGELARWIGTCTDIHSIKSAEEAVQNSESQFRQLADSMPQMVWTATPDGSIDYYNRRWYDYTGMNFQQSKDWGWGPVLHPDDLQNTIDQWTTAFTTNGPYEIEYRFKRADGVYRWHLGRARAIRDAHGAVVRWFGTCTDIEDYKQAETEIKILNEGLEERVRDRTAELDRTNLQLAAANEQLKGSSVRLEQSNRELQDFASVASHDLQEPLRKVQAFGDRLKTVSYGALDVQGRDYLDRMLNASKRMQSLIQDVLTLARVVSQANPFLPVDMGRITREVLSDLEVRIAETNALVEVGDLPTINADAAQMRQLMQNLIGNALKFHRQGKPPAVRVYAEQADFGRTADGMFRLVVEDQGIGFDEKYLDRIFTVFQRLHGRSEYEGTGIGLAICRKIARRHGGDITARSVLGQGSSFLVALPVRHAAIALGIPIAAGRIDASLTCAHEEIS